MSQAQEAWDAATHGWVANADLIERNTVPVQRWIMEHLDPQPGQTILDIGCGPGPVAFPVAARAGHVIATDISPNMIAAAEAIARERGVTNVEFRVMDAQALDLPDASVHGVVYRFGPMLLPDPLAAFTEAKRVLRDGGRYVATTWAPMECNLWNPMMVQPLVERDIIPQPDAQTGAGQMYSLADEATLEGLLRQAGFAEVTVDAVDQDQSFTSFDELWKLPTEIAGGLGAVILRQPPDDIAAIKERLRELAEVYRDGDGYLLPARANCVVAT